METIQAKSWFENLMETDYLEEKGKYGTTILNHPMPYPRLYLWASHFAKKLDSGFIIIEIEKNK
jgi:hypothetical protein